MTAGGWSYRAGACNIGPAETRARARSGWIGLIAGAVLTAGLLLAGAGRAWRVLVFVPLLISATGFVQARAKT